MTLDEIGVKHDTDKSSINHHYLSFYEQLAAFERVKRVKLLEIGVQFGNSIRTWREWFSDAYIVGLDSVDNGFVPEATEFRLGNAYLYETVTYFQSYRFDIIIDDGSHTVPDQQFVIANYSQLLAANGLLIIEDVPGMEAIPALSQMVPEKYNQVCVDMRSVQVNTKDSILFLVWPKQ